ncbi:leucine-rich repeats and immunoglobulin-like domains protein 3, partial [Anopheles maculipalpis]|uniref:leucine-rich repeats and immunoglobulin-like domains protein 3 n=1 Tax=Anopheles maculipalpis TaxID=1496333 RepID=UPI002158B8CA
RGNKTANKSLQMTIGSVCYYLSFSFATTIAAFHFICLNRNSAQCTLNNLFPEYEGTFVLNHIPEHVHILIFSQLMAKTVDHNILSNLSPTIKHVFMTESAVMRNIVVPSNSTVEQLFIIRTGLEAISFEENGLLVLLCIEKAPLHQLPPTLVNLKNVSYIKINHTPMEELNLSLICNLRSLATIDLNYNRIHYITNPQHHVHECDSKLIEISLANNRLTTLSPDVFAPFGRLEMLKLSDNMIETISGGFQNNLTGELQLDYNMLSALDLCNSHPMPYITTLRVNRNKLIHVPTCLERLPNIEVITLEHNQLSNISIDDFKQLKQLHYIRLSLNPIVSFMVHEHSLPPRLVDIDMRHNCMEHLNISQTLAQKLRMHT